MDEHLLLQIATILLLGLGAQLISYKLKIPSILLLIIFGIISGPILGLINPDEIFGHLLFPVVSISVAIILFEGGLSLRIKDIPGLRTLIFNLITIGVVITGIMATAASYYLLNLSFELSIIIGSILTVTGPTVIIPLLNIVKPRQPIRSILKWEGILIDPVGAVLAILVFESIYHNRLNESAYSILAGMFYTLVVGLGVGTFFAFLIRKALKKYFVPDYLQNSFSLTFVILAYVVSNLFQPESGLLTVTVMGVILANTSDITVRHILDFKETLRTLLIAVLFITLAARLELDQLKAIDSLAALWFLLILIFVIRPVSVFISAIGSDLKFREKLYLSFIAPRGIIAASVASIFALQLAEIDFENVELLIPYIFIVIIGTVLFYSLIASPLARLLGVKEDESSGILFIGANPLTRMIAKELQMHHEYLEIRTLLTDTNASNIYEAIEDNLEAVHGDFITTHDDSDLDLSGIAYLFAMTPSNEANSLAALKFSEHLGRSNVYQLPSYEYFTAEHQSESHLRGRMMFDREVDYKDLVYLLENGFSIKSIKLESEAHYKELADQHETFYPILFINNEKGLEIINQNDPIKPKEGWTLLAII